MSSIPRSNRKASDEDIIRYNSLGLSGSTIGKLLGVHPTSITVRLKSLGIDPSDTRRSFMEDVYASLTEAQQKWLAAQLGPRYPVKEFVKDILVREFINQTRQTRPAKAA